MKQNLFVMILYLLLGNAVLHSQNLFKHKNFGNELTLGFGGLVSGDTDISGKPFLDTYVLNSKFAIGITRNISIGFRSFQIWQAPPDKEKQRFNVSGLYFQWDFWKLKKVTLWVENGYYIGNFCPCAYSYAISRPNTKVFLLGGGAEIKIFDRFYLELSARQGLHIPKLPGVRIGDFGIFVHAGVNYHLKLKGK